MPRGIGFSKLRCIFFFFLISDYWLVLPLISGFVDWHQPSQTQVKEEEENIIQQKLCDEV
jgi:hypothetical protein